MLQFSDDWRLLVIVNSSVYLRQAAYAQLVGYAG